MKTADANSHADKFSGRRPGGGQGNWQDNWQDNGQKGARGGHDLGHEGAQVIKAGNSAGIASNSANEGGGNAMSGQILNMREVLKIPHRHIKACMMAWKEIKVHSSEGESAYLAVFHALLNLDASTFRCIHCGRKEKLAKMVPGKYCSRECAAQDAALRRLPRAKNICPACGRALSSDWEIWCGPACRRALAERQYHEELLGIMTGLVPLLRATSTPQSFLDAAATLFLPPGEWDQAWNGGSGQERMES